MNCDGCLPIMSNGTWACLICREFFQVYKYLRRSMVESRALFLWKNRGGKQRNKEVAWN